MPYGISVPLIVGSLSLYTVVGFKTCDPYLLNLTVPVISLPMLPVIQTAFPPL